MNAASYRHAKELEKQTAGKLMGKAKETVERMKDTGLSRPEFVAVLVGMAIKRFVEAEDETRVADVSIALQRLLGEIIRPRLAKHVLFEPNEFRSSACYREVVISKLTPKLPMMKSLFDFYSQLSKEDSRMEEKLMSCEEFVALCEDLYAAHPPRERPQSLARRNLWQSSMKAVFEAGSTLLNRQRSRSSHSLVR